MATTSRPDPDALRLQFDRRPMLVLGVGLVVGLTAIAHPANVLLLLVGLAALLRPVTRVGLLVAFLAGLLLTPAEPAAVRDRGYVDVVGTVTSVPRAAGAGEVFSLSAADRVWRVASDAGFSPSLGDRVRVAGVELPLREGSESTFLLHGVGGRIMALRAAPLAPGPWLWRAARAWRDDFHRLCRTWMAPDAAALTEAICFDLDAGLDPALTARLREIGTLHVVVASGLHVFVLAGALMWCLGRLPIPRAAQIGIVAGCLLLYAGATGLTPAVVRASLMVLAAASAYLFRREPDAVCALAFAAILYLVWLPREVYDPGFQISFLTVGGIALFYRPLRSHRRVMIRLAYGSIEVSWIAFAASAPLLAYYFGTLPIVGLPANLLVGPAAMVIMVSAFTAQIAGHVLPFVGIGVLAGVTQPLSGWVVWVTEHLSDHPWSSVTVPAFSAYWLVLGYGLLLLTWRPRIVQP